MTGRERPSVVQAAVFGDTTTISPGLTPLGSLWRCILGVVFIALIVGCVMTVNYTITTYGQEFFHGPSDRMPVPRAFEALLSCTLALTLPWAGRRLSTRRGGRLIPDWSFRVSTGLGALLTGSYAFVVLTFALAGFPAPWTRQGCGIFFMGIFTVVCMAGSQVESGRATIAARGPASMLLSRPRLVLIPVTAISIVIGASCWFLATVW